ncbi:uncharacterized protein PFL1_06268 [Pseudozyma flocculosa PF-1]|uniref:Uncharacterized protein n=1 Tax=Pseudozyma flocculosa PF-1 TaxID=1277687 RepID=A0A061H1S0_9BASI|nr:uncharacterized protein PFL1_06268 [Pseudozyma flocculosa PF-1]EPQ26059.1 hypothetical protein PFL1_06268 [Pseudozyma flocculosa PF-1]
MQSSASFSASRQGRPRPANLFPGSRSASDERPWPSPSFNSSMSLAKVDDVFADGTRSTSSGSNAAAMKRQLSGLPPTPITAGMMASPGLHGPKLPGLTDLFVNDEGILGPMTPLSTPHDHMAAHHPHPHPHHHLNQQQPSVFQQPSSSSAIAFGGVPMSSPSRTAPLPMTAAASHSLPRDGDVIGLGLDLETTPKASSKGHGGYAASAQMQRSATCPSPPLQCPSAPRIGVLKEGLFPRNSNLSPPSWQAARDFDSRPFNASVHGERRRSAELRSVSMEREAVVELSPRSMPASEGVQGLGISLDGSSPASSSTATFRAPQPMAVVSASDEAMSPPLSRVARQSPSSRAHTGLTPLVRSAKLNSSDRADDGASSSSSSSSSIGHQLGECRTDFGGADTPTKASSSSKGRASLEARGQGFGAVLPVAQLKASRGASTSKTTLETPIKSKPIFRLDNGSSGSKAKKKVQGHKMLGHESPWGVFGVKDEWRPLAAPNISRSGGGVGGVAGSGGKKLDEVACSPRTALGVRSAALVGKENVAPDALQQQQQQQAQQPPTPGKRSAASRHSADLCSVSSPPKKQRSGERPKTGSGTPLKENNGGRGAGGAASPQKRTRAASSVGYPNQAQARQFVGLR